MADWSPSSGLHQDFTNIVSALARVKEYSTLGTVPTELWTDWKVT